LDHESWVQAICNKKIATEIVHENQYSVNLLVIFCANSSTCAGSKCQNFIVAILRQQWIYSVIKDSLGNPTQATLAVLPHEKGISLFYSSTITLNLVIYSTFVTSPSPLGTLASPLSLSIILTQPIVEAESLNDHESAKVQNSQMLKDDQDVEPQEEAQNPSMTKDLIKQQLLELRNDE
ncbi:MAG: hypothetical protein EZS28_027883, partial [Streblomastix strix]